MLGLPEDSTKQPIIDLEAHKFNDLIQGMAYLKQKVFLDYFTAKTLFWKFNL